MIFPKKTYFLLLIIITLIFLTNIKKNLKTPTYSNENSPKSKSISTNINVTKRLTTNLPPKRLKTKN